MRKKLKKPDFTRHVKLDKAGEATWHEFKVWSMNRRETLKQNVPEALKLYMKHQAVYDPKA